VAAIDPSRAQAILQASRRHRDSQVLEQDRVLHGQAFGCIPGFTCRQDAMATAVRERTYPGILFLILLVVEREQVDGKATE
jgi:hypothetical protein